ncbi:phosphoglycolate phosphatase [Halovulum dunhuangense]|uniref:Phosphoglycolate phosphatase n=1 Tax=Halovulum dunhuangense TaxID=1505036 RepID=A0A849L3R5_9RHOB|nr:phosphoglycolate phosphatase [Halovulum dunhuangense]NNU80842.1 phosphoglycolate phosphatase [Halovulum dunhuangense]
MSAIVFDLDGTLIDSAPDIRAAANAMLSELGAEDLDLPMLRSFIGNGTLKLVERALTARALPTDEGFLHDAHHRFTAHYNASPAALTVLYPGVEAALAALLDAGHVLGICTNKPEAPARAILKHFGMADLFPVVVGGDSLPVRKPDPAPLRTAYAALGAAPMLYVGDSEVDADTAAAAGLPFALFTEGYRKSPVAALRHDFAFDHFDALPAHVAALRAA